MKMKTEEGSDMGEARIVREIFAGWPNFVSPSGLKIQVRD